ncbi:MAG: efflux RND transporter periplasmic adaptor subunit [Pseudomonadales bacterium]|nr:efflux RND transporter periplasmic adaptor subunit [Pseudomonadales bacterium]
MTVENDDALKAMAAQVRTMLRAEQGRKWLGSGVTALLVVLVLAALAWWFWPEDKTVHWQTHVLDRSDMVLTATATGNLQPKSEVTVGAEISGLVREVLVRENDHVKKGDVLARFDTDELRVALEQAEARLALAQASVAEAEATMEEASVDERRIASLMARNLASAAERDRAAASRKRAAAKLTYAHAAVQEARAAVSQTRTRLGKTVITAPITGVVLVRSVEPGTTVAASFQTPHLFLLAEDLSEMELHVALDEADVGMVKAGQTAVFVVDAWPGRQFQAEVLSVYLYPTTENNVVTYTTVLSVDNSEGLLQPGMTATATITTGVRQQALRVPNTALRFTPPTPGSGNGVLGLPSGRRPRQDNGSSNAVWVLRDGQPQRVPLRLGSSDGRYTEVLGGEISEGEEVITGVGHAAAGSGS